jgi:hypothetical protein
MAEQDDEQRPYHLLYENAVVLEEKKTRGIVSTAIMDESNQPRQRVTNRAMLRKWMPALHTGCPFTTTNITAHYPLF